MPKILKASLTISLFNLEFEFVFLFLEFLEIDIGIIYSIFLENLGSALSLIIRRSRFSNEFISE